VSCEQSLPLLSFARDRRAISAVEFAMLLPLMVTLYLGVIEVSQGVGIDRKVTLTTRTMADLASRVTSINNADMSNLLGASAAVMAP
jgi:Flp pilus assembly protein TadG